MERRLKLHQILVSLANNAYYQPPENTKIKYPCFIYHLNDATINHADDINYVYRKRYTVTYITRDPDDHNIPNMLNTFRYCSFDRWYASDNLHHFVYDLFF